MTPIAAFIAPLFLSAGTALSAEPALPQPTQDSVIAGEIETADAAVAAITGLPAAERTVQNTLIALDDVVATFFETARIPGFMADVSTDAAEREAGREAQNALSNWFDRFGQNGEVFRALQELAKLNPEMTAEQQRYFDEMMRDFKRAGLDLPEEKRSRLAEIDEEMNTLGSDFRRNIADDETQILLTAEELAGVPESFVKTLKKAGDLHIVELKGPTFSFVLGYCTNETTRQKVGVAAGLRGGSANVRALESLIALRHERATMLGYATTADYVIETKMAKTPDTVWAFYEDLRSKLRVKAEADFKEYQDAKREQTGNPEAVLTASDTSFYTNWLKREKYAVDTQKLREYFSMTDVTEGMFGVYQDLFAITFKDITDAAREAGRPMWHEDVRLFTVTDNQTSELLGEFYLDLHPRDGKFSHAAQFPLRLRKVWKDGRVSTPLVALVCNFTKPTEDQPSLLAHSEVETFFHEFGHCLHSILTRVNLANFSGTNVARDFVEAPSQMLENWTWQPEVLGRFAKHYETGEPLPKEIIEGMIAAKNLGSGMNTEAQVYLGMMDMRFHTDDDGTVDTTAVCESTYAETRLFTPTPHLRRQASFGHMVGYEAGYYGYLWSSVYAQDMWSRFADAPMDPKVAAEYREKVLSKGGTQDALDMVTDFLGREPNASAFLKSLGL